jgi:hypothetical protein
MQQLVKEYEDEKEDFINNVKEGKETVYINGEPVKYDKVKDVFYIASRGRRNIKTNTRTSNTEFKAPVMLRDSEIKKINGMLPYTIDASFTIKSKNNTVGNIIHYIIGVKSVLHLIKSKDLSDELQGLITGDLKNLQKVRYKTGEISFWKDYIFRKDACRQSGTEFTDIDRAEIRTMVKIQNWMDEIEKEERLSKDNLTEGSV